MNRIKDVTKIKIPSNHLLLEVVSEDRSGLALPDGVKLEDQNIHSRVVKLGDACKRFELDDVIFVMQHEPVGFPIAGKTYILTYEDNCAIGCNPDNVNFEKNEDTGGIIV